MSWGAAMSACRWRCSLRAVTGRDPRAPSGWIRIRAGICWRISRILQAGPPCLRPAPGGSEQEEGEPPLAPAALGGSPHLTRYHDFELGVARHLSALSERAEWPEIAPALSRLFARDYGLVFGALLKARLAPDFSVRHFVEKYLDLVFPMRWSGPPWRPC